jgi:hypothetical protein
VVWVDDPQGVVAGRRACGTVTGTLKDVEVTFAGVPTVASGMEVVTHSPLAKLLPLTTIVAVVPFGMVLGVRQAVQRDAGGGEGQ